MSEDLKYWMMGVIIYTQPSEDTLDVEIDLQITDLSCPYIELSSIYILEYISLPAKGL